MLESVITAEEGNRLLRLARRAILSAMEGEPRPQLPPEQLTDGLMKPLGAFVTLYHKGELRGCIGRMQYDTPLHLNVVEAPISTALNDPRFPSVTPQEVPGLKISLSILDEPQPVPHYDQFDPDQHGIVMGIGFSHGKFLPPRAHREEWGAGVARR